MKDTNTQALLTDGWTASSAILKEGDVFTLAGVYAVNPVPGEGTTGKRCCRICSSSWCVLTYLRRFRPGNAQDQPGDHHVWGLSNRIRSPGRQRGNRGAWHRLDALSAEPVFPSRRLRAGYGAAGNAGRCKLERTPAIGRHLDASGEGLRHRQRWTKSSVSTCCTAGLRTTRAGRALGRLIHQRQWLLVTTNSHWRFCST